MTTTIPEYKSEAAIPAPQMRALGDQDILILKVYKPYRHGWDDGAKKYRSFYYFPARLNDEVVYSWDERAKIQDGDTFLLREKFWDNEAKKFGFKKIERIENFYKTFRKVFDVDVAPSATAKFNIWDASLQKEIEIEFGLGNTFTLRSVPSSRVIGMIEALELDSNVELVDGKDKLGNPAKVRPFDFEDNLVDELQGKYVKFKVRWEGIDTRYQFKEGKQFDIVPPTQSEWISIEDLPF